MDCGLYSPLIGTPWPIYQPEPIHCYHDRRFKMSCIHTKVSVRLYRSLKADPFYSPQIDRVMREDMEFCPEFLGFVSYYYFLSKVIPRDRVVYDMGCCNACQAYYFRNHHAYVGVDLLVKVEDRIAPPNATHYQMPISKFLETAQIDPVHFAICNYVPPWHDDNELLVRTKFKHMFVYYPESREPLVFP